TVRANVYRTDLVNAGIGNGYHGFSYSFPGGSLRDDGRTHVISVKFTGTDAALSNTPKPAFTCPTIYEGYNEGADCNSIWGWAWDPANPNVAISVDVYEVTASGLIYYGSPLANVFRQDLLNAGKGNGAHGFSFNIPAYLRDCNSHTFTVRFARTFADLTGSPRSINCR